ncbi:MAG: Na+/H+ antiporter NhaA [Actinomycetota bacterium]
MPRLLARPLQQFLQTEASGGVLLLIAAAGALLWANIDPRSYETAWHTDLSVGLGRWTIDQDLRHWINDAAMAVFFFVVGLEIKRELVSGELRDRRAAILPVAAALGGMLVPALVYFSITAGTSGSRGWGIPMATDIAFAVGILAVVGRHLPSSLRLFLLTFAIVDDLGAILVIAIFYSDGISLAPLLLAAALVLFIGLLRRAQIQAGFVYLVLGIGVWLAVFASGIHATIAGVALAFVTPALAFQRPAAVSQEARRVAEETSDEPSPADIDAPQWLHLAGLTRQAVSPLARLEQALHPWTSFLIVPLFALANAGVRIGADAFSDANSTRVMIAVALGLLIGKIAGITLGALVASKLRMAQLPSDVSWTQVVGVAAVGGVGFTVSLFIAGLAFDDVRLLEGAKLGILAGSVLAGIAGSLILSRSRPRRMEDHLDTANQP